MTNLNYLWVGVECPKCKYIGEIQLVDVKSEKQVFCHNCKINIQLQDDQASVHNGVEIINKAFKNIENLFKNFGK
jgi:hypothetical protein